MSSILPRRNLDSYSRNKDNRLKLTLMQQPSRDFHRPVRRPSEEFDRKFTADGPESRTKIAHETAWTLVNRAQSSTDPELLQRIIDYTAVHGITDIAELWSQSQAETLPGTLWRLYLVQTMIKTDPATAALLHGRGVAYLNTADVVIVGAPENANPEEIENLIDEIMRGAFAGDFAMALERASAFCRIGSVGATHLANDYQDTNEDRATTLTKRALRLADFAQNLKQAAQLWRSNSLN